MTQGTIFSSLNKWLSAQCPQHNKHNFVDNYSITTIPPWGPLSPFRIGLHHDPVSQIEWQRDRQTDSTISVKLLPKPPLLTLLLLSPPQLLTLPFSLRRPLHWHHNSIATKLTFDLSLFFSQKNESGTMTIIMSRSTTTTIVRAGTNLGSRRYKRNHISIWVEKNQFMNLC